MKGHSSFVKSHIEKKVTKQKRRLRNDSAGGIAFGCSDQRSAAGIVVAAAVVAAPRVAAATEQEEQDNQNDNPAAVVVTFASTVHKSSTPSDECNGSASGSPCSWEAA